MKRGSTICKLLVAVVLVLGAAGFAWANGEDFFAAHLGQGIYYFGHVKDKNGKLLDDVMININVKNSPLKFKVRNDIPGHFRTPPMVEILGSAIGETIKPSEIEVTATKAGYKQASPAIIGAPSKTTSAVPVDFVLEPIAK